MKKSTHNILLTALVLTIISISIWSFTKSGRNYLPTIEKEKYGGLQLYTLRDLMGEDPESTLKAVAEAGYVNIEAAGYKDGKYYGMEPKEFKVLLKKYDLIPISSHQGSMNYKNIDQEIKDAKMVGFNYLVIPVPPMGMFYYNAEEQTMGMKGTAKELTEVMNNLGKKCAEAGLQLVYHNHNFEFAKDENGDFIIKYLIENTDPAYVNFEMDLYWVIKAGAYPLDYFDMYPGRFKLWHVKDMDAKGRFAPVGEGNIDFARILKEAKKAGMEYYFVEQDMTFDHPPLEAIQISHNNLKKFGFK